MTKRIIYVTDGDAAAAKAVAAATKTIGIGCLTFSGGNPTNCTYEELLKRIMKTKDEITVLLFDDAGQPYEGRGETLMVRLASEEGINVIGALAVASTERSGDWTSVDVSVDRYGKLSEQGVDKEGFRDIEENRIHGDTVYCLDQLSIPVIVGIGDLGKMGGRDDPKRDAPVTETALRVIIEREDTKDDGNKRTNVNEQLEKER
ncbi:stage V sporulation protein AE [Salicibibacter cibarius]|uniref:Stage V sporulation protein AE n=1 Tax=Salicibibacter cibarius TaxID=2743000 RepID=A0A7T6Z2V6_9BACI|nr:stage V sporulation protein AE [Salicibibacter cibarius]QQK75960.1 stage V sporulation protein AE [Salicibibacter cibarius]